MAAHGAPATDALWRWKQDTIRAMRSLLVKLEKQLAAVTKLKEDTAKLTELHSAAFTLLEYAYDDEYDNDLLNPETEEIVDHVENAGVLPSELASTVDWIAENIATLVAALSAKITALADTSVPEDAYTRVMTPERIEAKEADAGPTRNPRRRRA